MAQQTLSGRAASLARRQAQVHGKAALPAKGAGAKASAPQAAVPASRPVARQAVADSGRDAARARRRAMATHGKSAVKAEDRQRMVDTLRHAREQVQKKDCGCGCGGAGDCDKTQASTVESRSAGAKSALPAPRRREVKPVTPADAGRLNSRMRRQALARHGKNGADMMRNGLSSAQLVKQQNPDISGRELARSVRAQRASNGAQGKSRSAPVGRQRPPRPADEITGTRVSHSTKTTGDETGLCRSVTGTEYFSGDVFSEFCQSQPPQAPRKVEVTTTLRGGRVTSGGRVGRANSVTGDERGSCRNVTGNEYVGREQYDDFCPSRPEPGSAKVSHSQTTRGQIISGSKPARSPKVSGDEPGTCKAVTGTPYAGVEQYQEYCAPDQARLAEARSQRRAAAFAGRDITGLQPGLSGLTGAEKGACGAVSGTGYVGAAERQAVCGTAPAQPGEADFPQPLGEAPWGAFSVVAPSHASQAEALRHGVTGTRYEQGRISGTFSLAEGKVTGTEQFRFGERQNAILPTAPAPTADVPQASRVTGEGIDTGLKITGDDWDRGDRVTGTEGTSAMKRNPTRRGPISAMPAVAPKRNDEVPHSGLLVTGGSGNTEKGAPVTVSGGARG